MAPTHPTGVIIEIVGLNASDHGRSCEEHTVCGAEVLEIDAVVRFKAEQIVVNGKEETALAVFWVTDGVDRCKVGFLPRHLIKHKDNYDGKTAQIVEFLDTSACPSARAKSHRNKGVARAVLLEAPAPKTATSTANEDPNVIYIDRTKRTPTKKRSSTTTPDKDSAKKRVVDNLI
jgi:hypothetical protein